MGLSLFFTDGVMAPLTMVGDAPRFLQEIDIVASVVTATDEGIAPVTLQGDLTRLDWTGVAQVEEDWRSAGDGTFTRQRFYRGARWMDQVSVFEVTFADADGNALEGSLLAHAGRDDRLRESDDGFIRRFVARQIATGCPAVGDCAGDRRPYGKRQCRTWSRSPFRSTPSLARTWLPRRRGASTPEKR